MYWFIPLQPYEMSTVLEQWALPVKKKEEGKYMHWFSFKQGRDQALLLPLLLSCVSHMQPSSSASFDLHH